MNSYGSITSPFPAGKAYTVEEHPLDMSMSISSFRKRESAAIKIQGWVRKKTVKKIVKIKGYHPKTMSIFSSWEREAAALKIQAWGRKTPPTLSMPTLLERIK